MTFIDGILAGLLGALGYVLLGKIGGFFSRNLMARGVLAILSIGAAIGALVGIGVAGLFTIIVLAWTWTAPVIVSDVTYLFTGGAASGAIIGLILAAYAILADLDCFKTVFR